MTGINEQHFHGENYNVLLKEFLISTQIEGYAKFMNRKFPY